MDSHGHRRDAVFDSTPVAPREQSKRWERRQRAYRWHQQRRIAIYVIGFLFIFLGIWAYAN